MFSYTPLIAVAIVFGLLGQKAAAEPFRVIVSHSDSVSNDDPSQDHVSKSDDRDPATLKYIRQNTLTLAYAKKTRDSILDFFPGDKDLSMPSALPSYEPSIFLSGTPTLGVSVEPSETDSTIPSDGPSLISSTEPATMTSIQPTREGITIPLLSMAPSVSESAGPSSTPVSFEPSLEPSIARSEIPSNNPSTVPIDNPSANPSSVPVDGPSGNPSSIPSESPSENPTTLFTEEPSETSTESFFPSFSPSFTPTFSNFTDDFVEDSLTSTEFPSSNETLDPSSAPTIEECLITEDEREKEIFMILESAGDPVKIRDRSTPQGLAADWIIYQDFRRECPTLKIVQRWVIAVFYFATNGEFWEQCSAAGSDPCGSEFPFEGAHRFLSDFSECEWAGITCNNDDCVTEIEFEENALVGTIPTELGLLRDLAVLGMERGGLSSTIPSEIGLLTKLVFIDLDYNELTGSLPSTLSLLTNLETLDLNDNFLEGDIDLIGFLANLQFLQLQGNQFTGTIPLTAGNLTMMTTFNLHENSFSGSMPESVCNLRESNGGFLQSLIADCGNSTGLGPDIECDCCSSCRG